ncbi:uncharacterized protein LOC133778028 isoform X1 [Humulus lupulus]|uniref:uncharacterized protein LOC133778028 isoform X1 n=1 Tax=Humulus lupulus TaxID=3486 RepID=UPI002B40EBFB|nr:uncharacterized protein LOC133778028 isoform X1 [Humulus lupulus]XP_062073817.1 uncharacterized protein LOC133778028 isoform X1 [Humulus lupulus]
MNSSMSFKCFKEMTSKGKYANTTSDAFYRAKKVATEILEGSVKEQYAILEDYCNQIRATNPGSTAILKTRIEGDKRYFERVYICLQACKEGFNRGCRPLIGVDGCFLKGYCKGMLLAAIGIDAVNAMFPIAYAVVEKENKSSWTWFLELVKEDLQIQNPQSFCMLSDRQKGLEKALEKLFEGAEIRFCVRHLHANFKKDYPGLLLKQMLWAAARATTKEEWRRRMYDFKQISEPAYTWLSNKAPTEWTKSHFKEHVKCDMLCNNLCESFNAAIIGARDKTIIILLEKIRYWLMRRFCTKRESVKKWVHPVGKRILDIIEKNKKVARHCLPTMSTLTTFEVNFMNIEVFVVDLYKRTCACRSFQLNGIPCGHALACIWFSNLDVMNFIDDFYKKVAFEATYSGAIQPMSSPDKWSMTTQNPILPPPETSMPGRPKKSRRREVDEPPPGATKARRFGKANTCSNCKQPGHTMPTCKNAKVATEHLTYKKPGRPKKKNPKPESVKRRERENRQKARANGQYL